MEIVSWAQGARSGDIYTRRAHTLCHLLHLLNRLKIGDEAFKPVLIFQPTKVVPTGLPAAGVAPSRPLTRMKSYAPHVRCAPPQALDSLHSERGAAARLLLPHRPGLGVAPMRLLVVSTPRQRGTRPTAHQLDQNAQHMPGTALNIVERGMTREKRKASNEICPISPPKNNFKREWTAKSFNHNWEEGSVRLAVPIEVSLYISGVRLPTSVNVSRIALIWCRDIYLMFLLRGKWVRVVVRFIKYII